MVERETLAVKKCQGIKITLRVVMKVKIAFYRNLTFSPTVNDCCYPAVCLYLTCLGLDIK